MAEVAVAQTCSAQASRPRWPAATTAVILTLLAIPACRGLVSLLPYRGVLVISLGIALIVVSGVGLVVTPGVGGLLQRVGRARDGTRTGRAVA